MFFYPVLNFKYCSPILGCKLPRNRQTHKDQKTKKIVLSSYDTNLCLHTIFLFVPICFILVFQQLMLSTFCAALHTVMKQGVHFGCKCQMKT